MTLTANGTTQELPDEGCKHPWPPLIKMDEAVKAKIEKLSGLTCELLPRKRLLANPSGVRGKASSWRIRG
jgi:hypothetical protein